MAVTLAVAATGFMINSMPAGASTATAAAAPSQVLRLVAGSKSVTDSAGNVWAPDASEAVGGSVWTTTKAIANTASPGLFQTERWGITAYHLRVATPGTYLVTLNEAEVHWAGVGARVFGAVVNDVKGSTGRYGGYYRYYAGRQKYADAGAEKRLAAEKAAF